MIFQAPLHHLGTNSLRRHGLATVLGRIECSQLLRERKPWSADAPNDDTVVLKRYLDGLSDCKSGRTGNGGGNPNSQAVPPLLDG
jgi:hypothetical protein